MQSSGGKDLPRRDQLAPATVVRPILQGERRGAFPESVGSL